MAKKANEKPAEVAKEPVKSTEIALIRPNAKAMQADVGPKYLERVHGAESELAKAKALEERGRAKMREATSLLTLGVYNVLKADPKIAEACEIFIVKDEEGSRAKTSIALDALRIAIGTHKEEWNGEESKVVPFGTAAKFFVGPKDKEGSADYKRKLSHARNFTTELRTAATNALGLLDMEAEASYDEKKGVLMIAGPGVKEATGVEVVTLDERRDEEALKAEGFKKGVRPSLAYVREQAKEARGVVPAGNVSSHKPEQAADGDVQASLRSLINSTIAAINRCERKFEPETVKSLGSLKAVLADVPPHADLIRNGKKVA